MTELTENQQKVVDAIKDGHCTIEGLVNASKLSKSALTGTITSLTKKDFIKKADDGSYSLTAAIEIDDHGDTENEVNTLKNEESKIALLIPYLKSEATGEELKFALRSFDTNFKENIQVIIVGDREEWFSPEIIHIPHEVHMINEDCNCPAPSLIRNPQADVTHKIFTAIASGIVSGNFILSNDDLFLLGQTYLSDIEVLKAFGQLDKSGKPGGIYNQNAKRTAKVLEEQKLPINRYGTHIPMLLNAERLVEIIEKYKALDNGFLLTSLYFNEVFPEARPIQVDGTANDKILASAYRSDIDKNLLKKVFETRKFLNCDSKGWISIKSNLEEAFPNPSRYEQ